MGSIFGAKPPKATPAPLPATTAEPVDSEALARARRRAEEEKARRGRASTRVDLLQSTVDPTIGSGVIIP